MELFTLTEDWEIELTRPTLMAVSAFAKILTIQYNSGYPSDSQGSKRLRARHEFLYLYFMYDFRSEFASLDEESRHLQACEAAKLDVKFKPSDSLLGAIDKYTELQDTRSIKAVKAAWKGIDTIISSIESAGPDKAEEIEKRISNLGKLIEGLNKLENQVKKDIQGEGAIRGGSSTGRQG